MLVLSGPPLRHNLSEAEVYERDALALGVPPSALVAVRHDARSTLEEAQMLLPFLEEHGWRRFIVVTSNYHTRRTRMIYRALLRGRDLHFQMSAASDAGFQPERWWHRRTGLAMLVFEWVKYVNAWIELRALGQRRDVARKEAEFKMAHRETRGSVPYR